MSNPLGTVQAGQGRVEVSGTARVAEQSFTSPLTEQECVAYRFEKEAKLPQKGPDRHEDHRRRETWQTVHVGEAGAPFYLEDGGRRILVDGTTADLDVKRSYTVETSDFESGIGERILATVTGRDSGVPEETREVADEYVEEIAEADNERRYTEWLIADGDQVSVRVEAVAPERTSIGSSLDAGMDGPTNSARGGLVGTLKSAVGLASEVPADPRARYKPRALERLPEVDRQRTGDDERTADVRKTVAMFEGVPEGELSGNPDAIQWMREQVMGMTPEELGIADEVMPDVPAFENEQVVISWGQDSDEFVVSDDV
jgi:hypothetical protein